MNKTFWIGFVVVYVVMNVFGFLVHGIWLESTYQPLYGVVFRPEAEFTNMMWMMFVSGLIYIFLFCYIFTKGYEGKGIGEGVRYGLLIGLFMSVPMALDQYVLYPLTQNLALIWLVTGIINFTIGGAILSAIYKPSGAAHAAATA
jgi:hypothetical protein